MNERAILEQRVVTLSGLLGTPDGPLGLKAGALGTQFTARWDAERRLIQRILEESPPGASDGDLETTLNLWRERTGAFIRGASAERPAWTDKQGKLWDAHEVMAILDDIRERIEAWQGADGRALEGGDEEE